MYINNQKKEEKSIYRTMIIIMYATIYIEYFQFSLQKMDNSMSLLMMYIIYYINFT